MCHSKSPLIFCKMDEMEAESSASGENRQSPEQEEDNLLRSNKRNKERVDVNRVSKDSSPESYDPNKEGRKPSYKEKVMGWYNNNVFMEEDTPNDEGEVSNDDFLEEDEDKALI